MFLWELYNRILKCLYIARSNSSKNGIADVIVIILLSLLFATTKDWPTSPLPKLPILATLVIDVHLLPVFFMYKINLKKIILYLSSTASKSLLTATVNWPWDICHPQIPPRMILMRDCSIFSFPSIVINLKQKVLETR